MAMAYELLYLKPAPNGKQEVAILKHPNWLMRRIGFKPKQSTYWGSGTVWSQYPSGRPAGTAMDSIITGLVEGRRMSGKI